MSSYRGGKAGDGVYQRIICQIPPHRVYLEPFVGGGAILRFKRPALASIAIDADAEVAESVKAWNVPGCSVINGDAISWIAENFHRLTTDTFVYLDPPYLFGVRSSKRAIYKHEFGEAHEHVQLLDLIMGLPCMVAISGYWSQLYADKLVGWRSITFPAQTRSGRTAEEWLWMNYPEPFELHDYSYLGADYRERERIKRKKLRWHSRLKRMPASERYAVLSAIQDLVPSNSAGPAAGIAKNRVAGHHLQE